MHAEMFPGFLCSTEILVIVARRVGEGSWCSRIILRSIGRCLCLAFGILSGISLSFVGILPVVIDPINFHSHHFKVRSSAGPGPPNGRMFELLRLNRIVIGRPYLYQCWFAFHYYFPISNYPFVLFYFNSLILLVTDLLYSLHYVQTANYQPGKDFHIALLYYFEWNFWPYLLILIWAQQAELLPSVQPGYDAKDSTDCSLRYSLWSSTTDE